MNPILIG